MRYFTMSPKVLRFFSRMKKNRNTAKFSRMNDARAPKFTSPASSVILSPIGMDRHSVTTPRNTAENQGVWYFGCTLPNARGITPSRPMEYSRREDAIWAFMMLAMPIAIILMTSMIL